MVKVDHKILLTKLRAYGMSETTAKWFQSSLRDREQFVSIGNQDSTYVKVPHGVPQGSILNPLFFCYNDLPLYVESSEVKLDDTTLSCFTEVGVAHKLQENLVSPFKDVEGITCRQFFRLC